MAAVGLLRDESLDDFGDLGLLAAGQLGGRLPKTDVGLVLPDHVGLCPFHEDKTPSLRVTPGKGLFRCPVCGATGNVIQFVARKEGITDREAALKLCGSIPGVVRASALVRAARAETAGKKNPLRSR